MSNKLSSWRRRSWALSSHQITFVLAATLCAAIYLLFVPIDIVSFNVDNFEARLVDRLGWDLLLVFGVAGAALLLVALLPKVSAIGLGPAATSVALYFWAYGLMISAASGVFGGEHGMVLVADPFGRWESTIIIGGALAVIASATKWPSAFNRSLGVSLALLAINAGIVVVRTYQPPLPGQYQPEAAFRFSPSHNVLVILFDAMQSDILNDALNARPQLRGEMSGFTFFRNAVAPSPSTYLSLPAIHSGVVSDGTGVGSFFADTIRNRSFLTDLANAGFEVSDAFPVKNVCPTGVVFCGSFDPVATRQFETKVVSELRDFRLAPFALKRSPDGIGERPKSFTGVRLDRFAEQIRAVDGNPPTAKFIHLLTTHPPFALTENCQLTVTSDDRDGALRQTICALSDLEKLIAALKKQNLYDRTLIVVLGDHGLGSPSAFAKQALIDEGRSAAAVEALVNSGISVFSRANAGLLIKPEGAQGPWRNDDRPVAISQLRATICSLTEKCDPRGPSLFAAAHEMSTHFQGYNWRVLGWNAENVRDGRAFSIAGPPWRVESWRPAAALGVDYGKRYDVVKDGPFDSGTNPAWSNFGWSYPEPRGMWTASATAALWLKLPPDASEGFEIKIETAALLTPGHRNQDVDVLLDGQWIDHFSFGEQTRELTAVTQVAPGIAAASVARLEFRIANPRSPLRLGLSDDPRWLGINLRSLEFNKPQTRTLYQLGETLLLSDSATRRFANRGWANPEPWGSWIAGQQALIALPLAEAPKQDLVLSGRIHAYLDATQPELDAEVLVNGALLERVTLKQATPSRDLRLVVPETLLKRAAATIEFRTWPTALLGVGVGEISLSKE